MFRRSRMRSGVSDKWSYKVEKRMQVLTCPVCGGRGVVRQGFYEGNFHNMIASTSAGGTEKCRSCGGKGYIAFECDSPPPIPDAPPPHAPWCDLGCYHEMF
jgi:DnaJ-class molecular chaperone